MSFTFVGDGPHTGCVWVTLEQPLSVRLLTMLSLIGLVVGSVSVSAETSGRSIRLADCRIESSVGSGTARARCGWFDVAENRDDSKSKRIRIHVAIISALRRQALPDPVFIISGGPGQAASDFYLSSSRAFDELRRDRDLVVIDQRGTGKSNRLDCNLPDELEDESFDSTSIKNATLECLRHLAGDPRFYSTSVAVRDMDDIRKALGYQRINLYGISYGTRVAQHYVRRYPMQVRSVVLDGIVPVGVALGPEVGPAAQSALDAILRRCTSQAACQQAFPNIVTELEQLRAQLTRHSIRITVPDPSTAIATPLDFSYLHLAAALRLYSYSDDTASLLPYLIHAAAQDRPQALAAQALLVSRDLDQQIANGMHNAVVCTEDVPFFSKQVLNDPTIDRSYLRRVFVETLQTMCSVWPRGVIDADFHAPLLSDVPALLLSGENDPVTPERFGVQAARSFKNAKLIVVPGKGHGQLNNPCVSRVMTRYIDRASSIDLDLRCVSKQAASPFMLSATSPGP